MVEKLRINPFRRRASPDADTQPLPDVRLDPLGQNVDTVLAFYRREEQKINRTRRSVERLSEFVGQPEFLGWILAVVVLWLVVNAVAQSLTGQYLDPPPYFWLQGLATLAALLISTVVLIKQNRMDKSEAQRAHLDLQVNLLTEQKVSKLITLMEELRHDLPMVRDRVDSQVVVLQRPVDANDVLATIAEWNATEEALVVASEADTVVNKVPRPA